MRISLAGTIERLDPVIIIYDIAGLYDFDPTDYIGYKYYDIIAIGAGGGYGSPLSGTDPHTGHWAEVFGGAGGGGGYHRRQGLFDILGENMIDVVVGAKGADGSSNQDGVDGGYSAFGYISPNNAIVMACGGMGGKKVISIDSTPDTLSYADGGDGGIGGRTTKVETSPDNYVAGAKGGVCGYNTAIPGPSPQIEYIISGTDGETGGLFKGPIEIGGPGVSGTFTVDGDIGLGGGGGAGGRIIQDGTYSLGFPKPTSGGKGSYNSDEAVFSSGIPPELYTISGSTFAVKPGRGGGARITPLNGSNARYGDSGRDGIVAIRLTAE